MEEWILLFDYNCRLMMHEKFVMEMYFYGAQGDFFYDFMRWIEILFKIIQLKVSQ